MELRDRGLIEVEKGLRAVFIEPTDQCDPPVEQRDDGFATDGGAVQRLVHALTRSSETVDITEAELYETLANPRRRRILRYLAAFYDDQAGVYIDVRTISDALADRIADEDPGAARDDDLRHRHYVSITQQHAPALDEVGLAEYFEQVNKIRATEDGVAVVSLMSEISDLCTDRAVDPDEEVS
jgi:DNA-binding transcriptional ArsR family regulator